MWYVFDVNQNIHEFVNAATRLLDQHVVGEREAKRALLASLIGGLGIFLVGDPGGGKTLLAESVASLVEPTDEVMQLAANQEPGRLLGYVRLPREPGVTETVLGFWRPSDRAVHIFMAATPGAHMTEEFVKQAHTDRFGIVACGALPHPAPDGIPAPSALHWITTEFIPGNDARGAISPEFAALHSIAVEVPFPHGTFEKVRRLATIGGIAFHAPTGPADDLTAITTWDQLDSWRAEIVDRVRDEMGTEPSRDPCVDRIEYLSVVLAWMDGTDKVSISHRTEAEMWVESAQNLPQLAAAELAGRRTRSG
jgi:hypothetical protein